MSQEIHFKTRPETPAELFFNRRRFLRGLGLSSVACAVGSIGCDKRSTVATGDAVPPSLDVMPNPGIQIPKSVSRRQVTRSEVAAVHTNFYELSPRGAGDLRDLARGLTTSPWQIDISGACDRPRSFSIQDLMEIGLEERLYHFRCVERWAMNVPWAGFPLWRLLERVAPRAEARWFLFESAADPDQMPGILEAAHYPWPYREALRRDEAEHDLAFVALGVYGRALPAWHGAPMRLVVPWKYGYKSAKSIVKIRCLEEPPTTFWHEIAPHEYGLISNVNPNIPHPRWGQELSFWLRDDPVWPTGKDTFPTPIFNGYGDQVAHLYPDEPISPQSPLQPGEIAR